MLLKRNQTLASFGRRGFCVAWMSAVRGGYPRLLAALTDGACSARASPPSVKRIEGLIEAEWGRGLLIGNVYFRALQV